MLLTEAEETERHSESSLVEAKPVPATLQMTFR